MKMRINITLALAFLCGLAVVPGQAAEQLVAHTWVSGTGDDSNNCSRTAPCLSFVGAYGKTAAKGEISVLDSGNYGALTIDKSISIVADGVEAGILVPANLSVAAITISAASTDFVLIKGLQIEGNGGIGPGILVQRAKSVVVMDTVIHGFSNNQFGYGVAVNTDGANIVLKNVRIIGNTTGVSITSQKSSVVTLDSCTLVANPTGIDAEASAPVIVASTGSTIFGQATLRNGAQFISAGNNAIGSNLTPTSTIPLR